LTSEVFAQHSEGAGASTLSVFKGTYSQMKEERERLAAFQPGLQGPQTLDSGPKAARRETPRSTKEERHRKAQLQQLENQIASLEAQLFELGSRLESPPPDPTKVAQLGTEYERVQRQMDEKLGEWERLQYQEIL
jgi:DNA repair exonuclease SbcCD ATPase subunit